MGTIKANESQLKLVLMLMVSQKTVGQGLFISSTSEKVGVKHQRGFFNIFRVNVDGWIYELNLMNPCVCIKVVITTFNSPEQVREKLA